MQRDNADHRHTDHSWSRRPPAAHQHGPQPQTTRAAHQPPPPGTHLVLDVRAVAPAHDLDGEHVGARPQQVRHAELGGQLRVLAPRSRRPRR
eukprot:5215203-Prymnesium_polylepis.1